MRSTFLPFSRPSLGPEELAEVAETLKSGWITTGPRVQRFEREFAAYAGSPHAVAVNSATSGLHIAYLAAGLKPGDEVITSPLTFICTVSMMLAAGLKPVLADIDPATLNLDPARTAARINKRTRAIVPVHFAGLPCDMDAFAALARKHRLKIIEDAAHAVGTEYKGKRVGNLSDAAVFSFHPNKNMTTGEGGMITTPHAKWAEELQLLRFHGLTKNAWKRFAKGGSPHVEAVRLGYKYNMMDLQAAIGIHQLKKVDAFNRKRAGLAAYYRRELAGIDELGLQQDAPYPHLHPWHLFVAVLKTEKLSAGREEFIRKLSERNIGTGIHFTAVHRHRYTRPMFAKQARALRNATYVSDRILSLPLFPDMTEQDAADVVEAVKGVLQETRKARQAAVHG